MKVILYSGGDYSSSIALNEYALSLCPQKSLQLAYIPSSPYGHEEDFKHFVTCFKQYGIHKILYIPLDDYFRGVLKKRVFNSDIIFLSGGNTYEFLHTLRRLDLENDFIQFAKNGGILMGLSAGAIILTPSIKTASFPEFDRDENLVNLRKHSSLGVVKFEFFPHYKCSKRYDLALLNRSAQSKVPLIASFDGGGVAINGDETHFFGKTYCFYKKLKFLV